MTKITLLTQFLPQSRQFGLARLRRGLPATESLAHPGSSRRHGGNLSGRHVHPIGACACRPALLSLAGMKRKPKNAVPGKLLAAVNAMKKKMAVEAVKRHGDVTEAAKELGMSSTRTRLSVATMTLPRNRS